MEKAFSLLEKAALCAMAVCVLLSVCSFMKEGEKYPIDIFFCARRTSLSDFSMWTNFPITQE